MANIFDHLLSSTTAEIQVWSLPNVKGQGRERWIGTRDRGRIERFVTKRDVQGRGVFFCVSTIAPGQARKKENATELPFLFADVDFKDIDLAPEEIERVLRALPCPPSRMHHTGNGIHCFWILESPLATAADLDLAEGLLRRLALHLGGDPTVAHMVALLRVPGSHNSKRGEWRPVVVIREGVERYSPQAIDAWLGSARDLALYRRGRQLNPFERLAQEQGFRPPVDVEQRLQDMVVGGAGENGVHQTQLSCSASLVAAGVELDDAVALILDATENLPSTEGWNWNEEERVIRQMCLDAAKKFKRTEPRDIRSALEPLVHRPAELPEGVVSLAQARKDPDTLDSTPSQPPREAGSSGSVIALRKDAQQERAAGKERALGKIKKKNEHIFLGTGILRSLEEEGQQILFNDNRMWFYEDGVWRATQPDEERTWINVQVESGCRDSGIVSTTKVVNETRSWLQRNPDLHCGDIEWDAHGLVATQGGMIDWRDTSALVPMRPEHRATRRIECLFDPEAQCPTWENMLWDDYGFTDGTVQFLQEFAGVSLLTKKPRTLMRALVLLGPSNTGKSNILNVIAGLISRDINPTPLEALENSHGLMAFLRPIPWVLHEAFEQSRWELSTNAKALLSGDAVHVNVKNGPMLSIEFRQPVLWGTNVPPQFREASRAMENRLAIVKMHRSFNPLRITGTALHAIQQGHRTPADLVLATEMPGLLSWALKGLRRAMERGHFEFTAEMSQSLHAMRTDSNMATGFIEECCEHSPEHYVETADFYGAFVVWHRDHRGGAGPSVDQLGRAMAALSDPRVLLERILRRRVYAGLRLTEEGLDCWNAHQSSVMAERSGMRISGTAAEVNKVLGASQLVRGGFAAMQEAHRTWRPDEDADAAPV